MFVPREYQKNIINHIIEHKRCCVFAGMGMGKTASKIINEEIVTQAHLMLKDPDLSIKQISSILGFTNQSHFGSFIRKETGVSPQALRKKQL